ncbi:MAG: PP0621 family protein [Rhodoferax sp.]|nr:PP0621 family protein [Rhodoferax sp.]
MKALLYLALILAGVWLWRSLASRRNASGHQETSTQHPPAAMVCCHQCGVHLPANEAVTGADGLQYCSHAHLQQAQG